MDFSSIYSDNLISSVFLFDESRLVMSPLNTSNLLFLSLALFFSWTTTSKSDKFEHTQNISRCKFTVTQ